MSYRHCILVLQMNCQFLLQEYRKSGFKDRFGAKSQTLAKESAHLCARTQCAGVRHAKWHGGKARNQSMKARHESWAWRQGTKARHESKAQKKRQAEARRCELCMSSD